MTGTIAKPKLRGLLEASIKKGLIGAVIASALTGVFWKLYVMDPRKRQYAEFYKNYDPEKYLKIMCDNGLMQSCGPNSK